MRINSFLERYFHSNLEIVKGRRKEKESKLSWKISLKNQMWLNGNDSFNRAGRILRIFLFIFIHMKDFQLLFPSYTSLQLDRLFIPMLFYWIPIHLFASWWLNPERLNLMVGHIIINNLLTFRKWWKKIS